MLNELEEHRRYLNDTRRAYLYSRALAESVTPECSVIDLGAGTGILGMLAARVGARRVYAIDGGSIIELARKVADINSLGDRIHHIHGLSTEVSLPERADIVVADQIGRFGLECGIWQFFADARQRLLKKNGVCIPASLTLHIAPVECEDTWNAARAIGGRHADFDFSPALQCSINTPRPIALSAEQLLSEPVTSREIRLGQDGPGAVKIEHRFTAVRDGTLHAIAGWFTARLSPSVQMTNSPTSSERLDREQAAFLIEKPTPLSAGDTVSVCVTVQPLDEITSWRVTTKTDCGETTCSHSTFLARLTSKQEIERTRADAIPVLSQAGEARRLVLSLCDGCRTVAQIELELARAFPSLFSDPHQAAQFVGETVARYSRP